MSRSTTLMEYAPGRQVHCDYRVEPDEFDVRSARNEARWQDVIANVYASLDISVLDNDQFSGRIRQSSFQRLDLTRFETDGEIAHRTNEHIRADDDDYFLLNLALSGSASFKQFGRECLIRPGEYALLYTAAPYTFLHTDPVASLCLKIPAAALEARVNEPHDLCAATHTASGGLAKVVADLLISLDAEAPAIETESTPGIEASLLDMVGLFLSTDIKRDVVSGTAVRWATHRRAITLITEALSDISLNPDSIASRLGISTRYLHRVFEDAEDSVSGTLARLRLEKCRQDLMDPCLYPQSIKQIAFRNGFKSQSHFASAFRKRFGMTPKDMRACHQGSAAAH